MMMMMISNQQVLEKSWSIQERENKKQKKLVEKDSKAGILERGDEKTRQHSQTG